jgi:hypothetical protein
MPLGSAATLGPPVMGQIEHLHIRLMHLFVLGLPFA